MKSIVFDKTKRYKRAIIVARTFSYNKEKNNIALLEEKERLALAEKEYQDSIKEKEKEQLESAEQSVSERKSKKKKTLNFIFFILNIVVVVGILTYQITNEKITPIGDIENVKYYIFPILILLFFVVMILDAHRTNLFLKRSGNRSRPFLCYKMCAIGKYYDFITPMSVGGEPSQIFYMNHRGLDASSSISVPMARYVVSQVSWMIMGIIAVIVIAAQQTMDVSLVLVVGIIGFSINFLLTSVSMLLSLNKKLGNGLVVKILKFLQKIKIVKHYDKCYEKVNGVVANYQETMQKYAKNKIEFIYTIFLSILIFVINYTMPFLIYLMFGGTDHSLWFSMLVISVIIELASSIIPLPGGTGMNEISFTFVFGAMFPEGTVFWGLLMWRFVTYYIYLIQGIGIVIYDYFVGNRKFKWLEKKWELENESNVFREEQIIKYRKKQKKNKK